MKPDWTAGPEFDMWCQLFERFRSYEQNLLLPPTTSGAAGNLRLYNVNVLYGLLFSHTVKTCFKNVNELEIKHRKLPEWFVDCFIRSAAAGMLKHSSSIIYKRFIKCFFLKRKRKADCFIGVTKRAHVLWTKPLNLRFTWRWFQLTSHSWTETLNIHSSGGQKD